MATTDPYNTNSGMRCVKYMILIINVMFMITSVLLILVGTTIQMIFGDFRQFIDEHFLSPPALLVAVGAIMLLASVFGCIGAIKESTLLINLYGVFLFLIFILEISAAIAAFLLQGQVRGMLIRTMRGSMVSYEEDKNLAQGIDYMQSQLQCCGIQNITDWDGILTSGALVPDSCCINSNLPCEEYIVEGCLYRIDFIISQSAMLIATGATTVAFVQLLGVICAFMLAKTIRRNKSIREARRWQLQQNLGILAAGGKSPQDTGYTQLEKSEKFNESEPVTYTANSPSVN